jgi:L-fucose isomerase-like protein
MNKQMTFGVIVGNRGFFPDHLAKSGREEIVSTLENAGMAVVALGPEDSKCGAVETREPLGRREEVHHVQVFARAFE